MNKMEEVKTAVLRIFDASFDTDWDEEKILKTNVFDEFKGTEEEPTTVGFYDFLTEVFNLDDQVEGTISEIIKKIAEKWDGEKSRYFLEISRRYEHKNKNNGS